MADQDSFLDEYVTMFYTCARCRWCISSDGDYKPLCPMQERYGFFTYSSSGILLLARSLHDGTLDWEPEIADVVYACTMCKACTVQCGNIWYISSEDSNVPILVEKLREELISRGKIPPLVRDYLKSINLYGNPYKKPEAERGQWAEGLGIPLYS